MASHKTVKKPEPSIPPAPMDYVPLLHHLSVDQRKEKGRKARVVAPRSAHAGWTSPDKRSDPIALLEEQAADRVADLVPIRYGRMLASPFAFLRGSALIMASDLAGTPRSGLTAQLCGDAHLSNFGVYSAPDRSLVFDINDFDETLPGPWEWDVKRLAVSFEVAMRDRGFKSSSRRDTLLAVSASYREAMSRFADMTNLDVWYSRLDATELVERVRATAGRRGVERLEAGVEKARSKNSMRALDKLTVTVDGRPRIVNDPPLIVPVEALLGPEQSAKFTDIVHRFLIDYAATLPDDRRDLISQYEFRQLARKVVGVGSVGTRAWIALVTGRDDCDPLFLQLKEATGSVLERFLGKSRYRNHGRRVVEGQRLMQAASDILLGWYGLRAFEEKTRDYYVRQLWDGKASVDVAVMPADLFTPYARACAWTLARAHARSGDRIAIAAYLGRGGSFDKAIADFARAYADQTERDYETLVAAEKSGRIVAERGV